MTVRAFIHEERELETVLNLLESGQPTKFTARAQQLVQELINKSRTPSKELQTLVKVSVHRSAMRETLKKKRRRKN